MKQKGIIAEVLEAAYVLQSRKLWQRFTNYDCFGVRIANQDDLMLAVVLGDAGEQYGLSLFCGPDAAACLAALLDPEGQGDDALDDMYTLGYSMDRFGDLPPDAQAFIRQAGRHLRTHDQVPSFLAKPAGRLGRLPNDRELALLLLTLQGVTEADKKELLKPTTLEDPEGICIININNHAKAPQFSVTREVLEQRVKSTTIPLLHTGQSLADLARLNTTWRTAGIHCLGHP